MTDSEWHSNPPQAAPAGDSLYFPIRASIFFAAFVICANISAMVNAFSLALNGNLW